MWVANSSIASYRWVGSTCWLRICDRWLQTKSRRALHTRSIGKPMTRFVSNHVELSVIEIILSFPLLLITSQLTLRLQSPLLIPQEDNFCFYALESNLIIVIPCQRPRFPLLRLLVNTCSHRTTYSSLQPTERNSRKRRLPSTRGWRVVSRNN